jgi:hypothetical protein
MHGHKKLFFLIAVILQASSFCAQLTDALFPRTDPQVTGWIYEMLEVIDQLFTKHGIVYWIDGGTALGAVRHHGCIPWDDDADLVFHIEDRKRVLALKEEFSQWGFHLEETDIIRLFPSKEIKYPYVDIAGYRLYGDNTYRFDLQHLNNVFPLFYWLPHEIKPLVRVEFGPILLNAPNDMMRYLFTGYGADCLTHARYQTPHGGAARRRRINKKVHIVDFSPAPYKMH